VRRNEMSLVRGNVIVKKKVVRGCGSSDPKTIMSGSYD